MSRCRSLIPTNLISAKGLTQAAVSCFLTSLSLMIPFAISIQIFRELLKPITGSDISWTRLWIYFAVGIAGLLINFLFSRYDYQKTYIFSYTEAKHTRLKVAEQMRKMPMSFFNIKNLNELSENIMDDCTNIETASANILPQLIANLAASLFICIALSFWDWRMALALFIMLPISLLIFWLSRKLQTKLFAKHISSKLEAGKQSQEYFEGIKVIRSSDLDANSLKHLLAAFDAVRRTSIQVELTSGTLLSLSVILLRSGIAIVAYVGIQLLSAGQIDFLLFLTFLLIASRIYGPLLTVLSLLPDLLYLRISTQRLQELMDGEVMGGTQAVTSDDQAISFENVSFAYAQEPVLSNISFVAKKGEITALVGPSGSGKSSIVKLAARFWDVDTGVVRLGQVDVKNVDPEELMRHFAFVFQDVILFNDTIENNIRIGKSDASTDEIRAAAEAAGCSQFINQLPDAYQTMLGENGATLSGGERQRLSIARALLKDAPIVILDEATAALDPENEVYVQRAISKLLAGKTVLVIAHRLRTIVDADHIIVLDEGKIVEEGTSQQLLAKDTLFKRLYQTQQDNCSWRL
ncbi:MAG: ABC transporter ATP-binding protein [Eubacteriales bacterium]|nr:ABC transporter ATP-binding protein [Eubacteriales bacterium]